MQRDHCNTSILSTSHNFCFSPSSQMQDVPGKYLHFALFSPFFPAQSEQEGKISYFEVLNSPKEGAISVLKEDITNR